MSLNRSVLKGMLVLSLCLNFFILGTFGTMLFMNSPGSTVLNALLDIRPANPLQKTPLRIVIDSVQQAYPKLSSEGQEEIDTVRRELAMRLIIARDNMRENSSQILSIIGSPIFDQARARQLSAEILDNHKQGTETILHMLTQLFSRLSYEDRTILYNHLIKIRPTPDN